MANNLKIYDKIRALGGSYKMMHNDVAWNTVMRNYDVLRGIFHDYSKDYFTMEALENGSVGWYNLTDIASNFYWSKDGGATWTQYDNSQIPVNAGDKVMWKCNYRWSCGLNRNTDGLGTDDDWWYRNVRRVETTCQYKVYGNIQSLWYGDDFVGQTTMKPKWHYNTNNVYDWSYGMCKGMFCERWSSNIVIIVGPTIDDWPDVTSPDFVLPENDNSIYDNNLDKHYLVDAKNLIIDLEHRYNSQPDGSNTGRPEQTFAFMFYDCQLLENGPTMTPPDYVGNYDYYYMFNNCKRMRSFKCSFDCFIDGYYPFDSMFSNCMYLEEGPDIIRGWYSSTEKSRTRYYYYLDYARYGQYMFWNCQMLKKAPKLYSRSIECNSDYRFAYLNNNNKPQGIFAMCRSLESMELYVCNYQSINDTPGLITSYDDWTYIMNNNTCTITTNTTFVSPGPLASKFTINNVGLNFDK